MTTNGFTWEFSETSYNKVRINYRNTCQLCNMNNKSPEATYSLLIETDKGIFNTTYKKIIDDKKHIFIICTNCADMLEIKCTERSVSHYKLLSKMTKKPKIIFDKTYFCIGESINKLKTSIKKSLPTSKYYSSSEEDSDESSNDDNDDDDENNIKPYNRKNTRGISFFTGECKTCGEDLYKDICFNMCEQ